MVQDTPEQKQSEKFNGCEVCGHTGYISSGESVRECICLLKHYCWDAVGNISEADMQLIVPRNQAQEMALEILRLRPDSSYYIYGAIRSGKTFFAGALHNNRFFKNRSKVIWFRDYDIKQIFRRAELKGLEPAIMHKVRTGIVKFVYWDDLGKSTVSDFVLQSIYHLLDEIMVRNCKLVITSVFSLPEIASIYGASIARRIEDISMEIICLDTDENSNKGGAK